MQHVITDDLMALLTALPPSIQDAVNRLDNRADLLEIVMDLGRLPEGRFPEGEVILSNQPVTSADLEYVVEHIGEFGDDNRAGIERTLHRISALRNRKGKIVGLTCRIGRAVLGSIALIRDIVDQGQSILILGRPGVGKTTLLREIARVLADEANKRVVIVDTSNEIAGDGDIPHPGIGRARRMQVARTVEQHSVMIEAVENHMPQVIVIDEIGTELEAAAARTIAERGVQLVATAHGNSLGNLLVNPTLSDLVGGIQTVTLGDEEARRRHTQKSIQERKSPPTFDVVVEQQSWDEVIVHRDVAETVDTMLRGQPVVAEERTRDEDSDEVSVRRINTGGVELPNWGTNPHDGFTTRTFERNERPERGERGDRYERSERPSRGNNVNQFRSVGAQPTRGGDTSGGRFRGRNQSQVQVRALAPTGTAPSEKTSVITTTTDSPFAEEGIYQPENAEQSLPLAKTMRVYPFGVNRDRLADAARQLRVPVLITNDQEQADAVISIKNFYRRQPDRLVQAEQDRKLIIILKNNTVAQMQHALARIFDIPVANPDAPEESNGSNGDEGMSNNLREVFGDIEFDDPTKQAMLETEDAIHQVLNKGLMTAELPPANAYVRRLQHQMATRYNLTSRSRGKEPYRRVKIFRTQD